MTKDKKTGIPKAKEGWKERTKELKISIVQQPDFNGIVFMLGQVPLRKIGVQKSTLAIPGMPSHTVVNASYIRAPEYRIIFTPKGCKCYTKGAQLKVLIH